MASFIPATAIWVGYQPVRARKNLFVFAMPLRLSAYSHSGDWVRRQRIQLIGKGRNQPRHCCFEGVRQSSPFPY